MNAGLAFGLTSVLGTALGIALMQEPARAAPRIGKAAEAFLASLPVALRERACAPFDPAVQREWHFVPREYPGVALGELEAAAAASARALLATVLSDQGMQKVDAVRAIEDVLRELEAASGGGTVRDPGRYWLQILGDPVGAHWAFRLQGHHLSLHFTVDDGRLLAATPTFVGSNPHEVPSGPHRGERVLGRAEDLARGLLATLDDAQLRQAMFAGAVPADVLAGPGRDPAELGAPQGIAWPALTPGQQELLWSLLREFVLDHEREFAAGALARHNAAGRERLHFLWAGSAVRGQGHYFRIHGPTVLVEYDNTQNEANHVHALYRDLERDFGGDPLRAHRAHEHGDKR